MSTKTKSVVTVITFIVLIIALWAGGGTLWRMLLAMHGVHPH
jgi:hypothetical protein